MADKEISQAVFFLEFCQEGNHLRLDCSIERRRRFIQDQQTGFKNHRACKRDTLSLTAGKLMGITVASIGIEPHFG